MSCARETGVVTGGEGACAAVEWCGAKFGVIMIKVEGTGTAATERRMWWDNGCLPVSVCGSMSMPLFEMKGPKSCSAPQETPSSKWRDPNRMRLLLLKDKPQQSRREMCQKNVACYSEPSSFVKGRKPATSDGGRLAVQAGRRSCRVTKTFRRRAVRCGSLVGWLARLQS